MTLRQLIFHNFWLKLTSLAVATLLWLVVHRTLDDGAGSTRRLARETASREFPRRPVLVMTQMSDRRGYGAEPPEVSVTIRGPAAVVEQLQDSDIRVFVRLEMPQQIKGGLMFRVEVSSPRDTTVVKVAPERVLVRPLEGS